MKNYKSKASAAMHEMMSGFHKAGAIPENTMREFDEMCLVPVENQEAQPLDEATKAAIQIGLDQIENGQYTELTAEELPAFVEAIKTRGRQRKAEKAK